MFETLISVECKTEPVKFVLSAPTYNLLFDERMFNASALGKEEDRLNLSIIVSDVAFIPINSIV
jgi:hypothetical protein